MEGRLTYITEAEAEKLLTWPAAYEACEQNGLAFTMLGFIENYRMKSVDPDKVFEILGSKMLTSFANNKAPLPIIMSTCLLFDTKTGAMKTIIEANGITAYRTAASSLVGTKYLYFDRNENQKGDKVLAIWGCGIQGRIHAIGTSVMFPICEIHLWNRSASKAHELKKELDGMTGTFKNKNVKIFVHETVRECVKTADIIVTATQTTSPVLMNDMVKENVHINAVGASKDHHSEIELKLYLNSKLYVDSWISAGTELKGLNCPIEAELGELISGSKKVTTHPRTIYHSLGLAVTDAATAQIVETLYHKKK